MFKTVTSVASIATVTTSYKGIKMNIGNFCRAQILLGKKNVEILELVQAQFPQAKTTAACIAWYKSDMRKKGMIEKKAESKAMSKEELLAALEALQAAE